MEKAKSNNIENEVYNDDKELLNKGYVKIRPPKKGSKLGRWTWSLDKFNKEKDNIYIKQTSSGYSVVKKEFINQDQINITSEGALKSFIEFSSANGTKTLLEIFNEKVFDNPKPIELIRYLIKAKSNSKNSIILDFFAGSGTTGQAVMELNEEDGGKRQFILVTNNENDIGKNITRERLYRVIKGEGSKAETFSWKYSNNKPYLDGNRVMVFDIETHDLTLNDLDKAEKLKEFAKSEFKKLNPNYSEKNDFNIYNDLSSLRPEKKTKEEDK